MTPTSNNVTTSHWTSRRLRKILDQVEHNLKWSFMAPSLWLGNPAGQYLQRKLTPRFHKRRLVGGLGPGLLVCSNGVFKKTLAAINLTKFTLLAKAVLLQVQFVSARFICRTRSWTEQRCKMIGFQLPLVQDMTNQELKCSFDMSLMCLELLLKDMISWMFFLYPCCCLVVWSAAASQQQQLSSNTWEDNVQKQHICKAKSMKNNKEQHAT